MVKATDKQRAVALLGDLMPLELIAALRGGVPERCDFCEQPFTDERYATPEEAGQWACIECVKRWELEDAARANK